MSNKNRRRRAGPSRGGEGPRGQPRRRRSPSRPTSSSVGGRGPPMDRNRPRDSGQRDSGQRDSSQRDSGQSPAAPGSGSGAAPSSRWDASGDRSQSAARSVANQHVAVIRPSPAAPASQGGSASSSNGTLRPDVKRATEYLCERLFWYMRRDTADKNHQKLQDDLKRCRGSYTDFGSAAEFLKKQTDTAGEEKARCCARLDAADEKLYSSVQQLVGRLPLARPDDPVTPQSEQQPSERTVQELEARLTAKQKSAEASFASMLAQESLTIQKTLRAEFDVKTAEMQAQLRMEKMKFHSLTAELQAQLRMEKMKNQVLTKSVETLEHRLDDAVKSNHGAVCDTAQKALNFAYDTRNEIKDLVPRDEFHKAFKKLDGAFASPEGGEDDELLYPRTMPGEEAALKLRLLDSQVKSLKSAVQEQGGDQIMVRVEKLKMQLDGHEQAIKQQAVKQAEAQSAIQAIGSSLSQVSADKPEKSPEAGTASAQDANVRVAPQNEAEDEAVTTGSEFMTRTEVESLLRDLMPIISTKLHKHLVEEQAKRDLIAKEADKTAEAATVLRTDLELCRGEYGKRIAELAHAIAGLGSDLVSQRQRLDILERTWPAANAEGKRELEELAMQLRDLQSWQNNFTTKQLYKDIVDHINAKMPNGVMNQFKLLASRVAGLEYHLYVAEGGESKKRKLVAESGDGASPAGRPQGQVEGRPSTE